MDKFCPLIKDKCKDKECVMWEGDFCYVVVFVANLSMHYGLKYDAGRDVETISKKFDGSEEDMPEEILAELKSSTAEELALELYNFIKKETAQGENPPYLDRLVVQAFWESKKVKEHLLSKDMQLKVYKAESLAQKRISDEYEAIMRERLVEEKKSLPSLAEACVTWARQNGLKSVTRSDFELFLSEKNIEMLSETKRLLYCKTNVELKARR